MVEVEMGKGALLERGGKVFLVFLSMAVVAYMSLKRNYPPVVQGLFDDFGSGILHALAYGGLTAIYFWAFLSRRARGYLWAAVFSVSYGFVLEVAQLWVPGRTFSAGDLAVNCLAALLVAVVLKVGRPLFGHQVS